MIDIAQWRATIGLWCCHQIVHAAKKGTITDISRWVESLWSRGSEDECGDKLIFLFLFLLLLVLSADIELNPGPKTGSITNHFSVLYICHCFNC